MSRGSVGWRRMVGVICSRVPSPRPSAGGERGEVERVFIGVGSFLTAAVGGGEEDAAVVAEGDHGEAHVNHLEGIVGGEAVDAGFLAALAWSP